MMRNCQRVLWWQWVPSSLFGGMLKSDILPQVVQYSEMDQEERVDPMIYVFPRMTKCHFHKFGPSGSVERHDAFCLLPLNILNEKVSWLLLWWLVKQQFYLGCCKLNGRNERKFVTWCITKSLMKHCHTLWQHLYCDLLFVWSEIVIVIHFVWIASWKLYRGCFVCSFFKCLEGTKCEWLYISKDL